MSSKQDEDEFDATLRVCLAAELDGQLGRAERAFRNQVRLAPPAQAPRRRPLRSHVWVIGATAAAVAASMAAMWVVPTPPVPADATSIAVTQPGNPGQVPTVGQRGVSEETTVAAAADAFEPQWEQVQEVVDSMTVDDGLVLLEDNRPARLVRQVALQRVEWVDERLGARVQAVLPREGVRLIPVDTY